MRLSIGRRIQLIEETQQRLKVQLQAHFDRLSDEIAKVLEELGEVGVDITEDEE